MQRQWDTHRNLIELTALQSFPQFTTPSPYSRQFSLPVALSLDYALYLNSSRQLGGGKKLFLNPLGPYCLSNQNNKYVKLAHFGKTLSEYFNMLIKHFGRKAIYSNEIGLNFNSKLPLLIFILERYLSHTQRNISKNILLGFSYHVIVQCLQNRSGFYQRNL